MGQNSPKLLRLKAFKTFSKKFCKKGLTFVFPGCILVTTEGGTAQTGKRSNRKAEVSGVHLEK